MELSAGDLVLDPATRSVSRGGVAIETSSREFAVLEHLMRHQDAVVAKQQLLGAVWGFDFDGDPNIVEVYVSRLRRKVDKPFGRDSVETVRGTGYRVRADR